MTLGNLACFGVWLLYCLVIRTILGVLHASAEADERAEEMLRRNTPS